jgi:hypothetical protein
MVGPEGFVVIDGTLSIEEQQREVRSKIMRLIPKQPRSDEVIEVSETAKDNKTTVSTKE